MQLAMAIVLIITLFPILTLRGSRSITRMVCRRDWRFSFSYVDTARQDCGFHAIKSIIQVNFAPSGIPSVQVWRSSQTLPPEAEKDQSIHWMLWPLSRCFAQRSGGVVACGSICPELTQPIPKGAVEDDAHPQIQTFLIQRTLGWCAAHRLVVADGQQRAFVQNIAKLDARGIR